MLPKLYLNCEFPSQRDWRGIFLRTDWSDVSKSLAWWVEFPFHIWPQTIRWALEEVSSHSTGHCIMLQWSIAHIFKLNKQIEWKVFGSESYCFFLSELLSALDGKNWSSNLKTLLYVCRTHSIWLIIAITQKMHVLPSHVIPSQADSHHYSHYSSFYNIIPSSL